MAAPTINEQSYMQFTAADQEATEKFRIRAIAWVSFTGSVIVDTDVLNIEDGAGITVFKMSADAGNTTFTMTIPGDGITVTGIKAEDMTHGYLYVFGERL